MKLNAILLSLILVLLFSCQEDSKINDIDIVNKKMKAQEDCWNKGDLDCFMQHYWHDERLEFIGKSGLTKGWSRTLENYKKSYPNLDKMGTLKFENIKNEQIDFSTIHTIGQWQLARPQNGDTLSGYYSLIWQKRNTEWVIISDHSS